MTQAHRHPDNYRIGLITVITSSILFGIYPAALRSVYAAGADIIFVVLAVIWARSLGLIFYCLWKRKALFQKREDIKQGLIGGVFQAASSGCIMAALHYLPGPIVSITIFSHTLMLLFYLAWRGEIKLDALNLSTTVAALIGLTFVLDVWHAQPTDNLVGIGLVLLGAVAIVMRLYVYDKQTRERHPAIVGAENFIIAALLTSLLLLFRTPQLPVGLAGWGWLAAAGLSMAVATFLYFYAIAFLGSFQTSLFMKIEPVAAAIFCALLIGEILKPYQYFGIILVLAALVCYQILSRTRRVTAPAQIEND